MSEDDLQAGLARAAELFNAGDYHAAHEALDELWERSQARDSDFLKGLIQAAIALHHAQRDNPAGARKLHGGMRQYLGHYLPGHRGLDVAAFLADMQRALGPIVRAAPGREPRFDPAAAPRLAFGPPRGTAQG